MNIQTLNLSSNYDTNVLFIRQVFFEDLTTAEDDMQSYLMNISCNQTNITEHEYDEIPKTFTGIDSWIKKINLLCWSCSCGFNNMPWFIPKYYNKSGDKIEMGVHGVFCSPNCAADGIICEFGSSRMEIIKEKQELLKILYYIFNNKKITYIPVPVNKTVMVQYGGTIKQSEYRYILTRDNSHFEQRDIDTTLPSEHVKAVDVTPTFRKAFAEENNIVLYRNESSDDDDNNTSDIEKSYKNSISKLNNIELSDNEDDEDEIQTFYNDDIKPAIKKLVKSVSNTKVNTKVKTLVKPVVKTSDKPVVKTLVKPSVKSVDTNEQHIVIKKPINIIKSPPNVIKIKK